MSKKAMKLALDLATMHHSDDGYQELRQKVRRVANAALAEQSAQQEPVAWLDPWTRNNVTTDYDAYGKHGIPLYTSSPAQRKPLTDEEIENIIPDDDTPMSLGEAFVKFARAIEAAHGIKEQP